MIHEVLELLFVKGQTPAEAARELGIKLKTFRERVEMLAHMGYIERFNEGTADCGNLCWSCTVKKSCSLEEDDLASRPSLFQLTEKGKKLLGIES